MRFIKFRKSIFSAEVVLSKPDEDLDEADAMRAEAVEIPAIKNMQVAGR